MMIDENSNNNLIKEPCYIFNMNDINDLFVAGVIERIDEKYKIVSVADLYLYGKSVIRSNQEQAIKCFQVCVFLEPNNYKANFQLLINDIYHKEYQQALKRFEVLQPQANSEQNSILNFCLVMLGMFSVIPDAINKAKNLSLKDVLISTENAENDELIQLRNKIMTRAIYKNFPVAKKLMAELHNCPENITQADMLVQCLVHHADHVDKANAKKYTQLIRDKRYNDLISELNGLTNPSKKEIYCLAVANEIIEIQDTDTVPKPTNFAASTIFEAIDGKNYGLALRLAKELQEDGKAKYLKELVVMLEDICNLIKFVIKPILPDESSTQALFSEVVINLNAGKTNAALQLIHKYLEDINKLEYEFLVVNLIKIELLEKDTSFKKTCETLNELNKSNLNIDVQEFIDLFYIKNSQKKVEIAVLYLNIIEEFENLGVISDISSFLKQLIGIPTIWNNEIGEFSSMENIIDSYHQEIQDNQDIALIPVNDEEQAQRISFIAEKYLDMKCFWLNTDNKIKVVLRPIIKPKESKRKIKKALISAQYREDHTEILKLQKELLFSCYSSDKLYIKIGLTLLKLGEQEKAEKYLEVAKGLLSFTKAEIKVSDFDEKTNYYYGIENMESVNEYILSTGLSIDEACIELGLSLEQIDIIRLIYAREFYSIKEYELGDKFLKAVERSKNKTEKTSNILNEIKENKNFYFNRERENVLKHSLLLKP